MNRTVIFALVLAFLALPVCAQTKTAGERVDDTWIHTKVKSTLATKMGSSIDIEVYKGEVQLSGFTGDAEAPKRLSEAAARVKGVKKVYNQIIYVDSGRSAGEHIDDGLLVTSVNKALSDDHLRLAGKVNVEVNKGTVLLSGFIDSEEQRARAIEIARTVKGTVKVIDGMNLKSDV